MRLCTVCGTLNSPDAKFCATCRRAMGQNTVSLFERLGTLELVRIVCIAAVLLFFVLFVVDIVFFGYGIGLIASHTPYDRDGTVLYLAVPWLIGLVQLQGIPFFVWFIILMEILLATFLLVFFKDGRDFRHELGRIFTRKQLPVSNNTIIIVAQLFMAYFFIGLVYSSLLTLLGIKPSSPSFSIPLWKQLYLLANASVYEELIIRLLLIGLPLYLISLLRNRANIQHLLGGTARFDRTTLFFIIISSWIFALAHVFSWDLYKLPTTFIAGLVLGYLFVKKGLYAAIILHFTINYFAVPAKIFETGEMVIGYKLAILFFSIIGCFYFLFYLRESLRFGIKLLGQKQWSEPVAAEVRRREEAVWFRCENCGGTLAEYRNGVFECLKCGASK